jgi:hypothetical protein
VRLAQEYGGSVLLDPETMHGAAERAGEVERGRTGSGAEKTGLASPDSERG